MRDLTPAMAAALAEEASTLATCWRLQRRDGVLVALTTHDRDLEIGGVRYRADGGLTASAVMESGDLAIDNMEVAGVLSSGGLPASDLAQGRFDGARVDIFLVDWRAPESGSLLIKRGTLGAVTREDGAFRADLRGLSDALKRSAVEAYSATCRAELGDRRCKRSLNDFEREAEIDNVVDAITFDAGELAGDPDGWYDVGRIRWHLGANAGLVSDIRGSAAGRITLFRPPPEPMAPGDVFTITAGCIKTLAICDSKFDNVPNFRGDPFVPGTDAVLDFPGLR